MKEKFKRNKIKHLQDRNRCHKHFFDEDDEHFIYCDSTFNLGLCFNFFNLCPYFYIHVEVDAQCISYIQSLCYFFFSCI